MRRRGYSTKWYDSKLGCDGDLALSCNIPGIMRMCRESRVAAVMLAPPCTTFPMARDRTEQIRSHKYPNGVPWWLNDKGRLDLNSANEFMSGVYRLITTFMSHSVPFIVENPLSSRLWKLPFFAKLCESDRVHLRHCDQCQYGTQWRKATTFLCGNIDQEDSMQLQKRCHGKTCSSSQLKHIQLDGRTLTRKAQFFYQ